MRNIPLLVMPNFSKKSRVLSNLIYLFTYLSVCLFVCLFVFLLVFAGERYFKRHAAKQETFSMGVMEHNGITLANIDILDNYGEEPRNYL